MNSKRMNRLEELGRVDSEKAYTKKGKRNLKDEKKRIVNELKDGGEAKQTWITKKSDKTITKQSVNKPKKIEGASQWITKKSKPYITKKSPDKIQDRERVRKAMGGSLKAIPSGNKGLKKLPTQVRNKMGYMKNGGRAKMKSGGLAKRGRGCEIR
jgi:hypothetical protein